MREPLEVRGHRIVVEQVAGRATGERREVERAHELVLGAAGDTKPPVAGHEGAGSLERRAGAGRDVEQLRREGQRHRERPPLQRLDGVEDALIFGHHVPGAPS